MASQYLRRDYKPFGVVHITVRGFRKRRILFGQIDRQEVLDDIRSQLNQLPAASRPMLLSYALMNNHIHLLFQHGSDPRAVQRIVNSFKIRFAKRFNLRHGTSGRVWEKPFRSRVVRGGEDLINVVAYIHLNPDASARDQHSSHPIYLGAQPAGIVSTGLVLKAFGGAAEYAAYFADTVKIRAARAAAKRRINQ